MEKSSGETKGRQGSSSRNYDVLGRELFTPDEVRKLDNKSALFLSVVLILWLIINLCHLHTLHLNGSGKFRGRFTPSGRKNHLYRKRLERNHLPGIKRDGKKSDNPYGI